MRHHLQNARGLAALIAVLAALPLSAGTVKGRITARGTLTDPSSFVVSVEDIDAAPANPRPAVMDQKRLRFEPHVLAIPVGTIVTFPNSDPLSHNIFSISPAKRFNLGLFRKGAPRQITFDKPGVVALLCNVHLEMAGFIVVLRNRFFAQTDGRGAYHIAGLPPGRHRIRCWHERLQTQEKVIEVPASGTAEVDFNME